MSDKKDIVLVGDKQTTIFDNRPDLKDSVRNYAIASEAKNTAEARKWDWKTFTKWCSAQGVEPSFPVSSATAAAFLADQSRKEGKAVATVIRYARSIHAIHKLREQPSPISHEAVKKVLQGIRRERGTQQKKKAAFSAEFASGALPKYQAKSNFGNLRDRAIVLLGLATALRASEICGINVEDIKIVDSGMIIDLKRSKTDQEGKGCPIAVGRLDDDAEFCPVAAVQKWLLETELTSGPLFFGLKRNGQSNNRRITPHIVRETVRNIVTSSGVDAKEFGSHSLRAGYVTTARMSGVDWVSIMEQTRHRRLETAKLYTRYTPDVFVSTRVADVFRGAFKKNKK